MRIGLIRIKKIAVKTHEELLEEEDLKFWNYENFAIIKSKMDVCVMNRLAGYEKKKKEKGRLIEC